MAALMPIMELSKKWMDATGGEIMDEMISDIPIFTDMFGKNDMTAIHEMIKNTKKSLDAITAHIRHPQRKMHIKCSGEFRSLITCMNESKCGFEDKIQCSSFNFFVLQN